MPRGRPFKAGESGNPAGKPRGAKDKRTELRDLLRPHAPEVVQMAKDGDAAAMRICIDRLIPPIKAAEEPIKLEGFDGTLSEQGQAILCAMAEGKLASSQTASLLQALAAQTRIVEAEELDKRLRALEEGR